jgi:hypothetical protein
MTRTMCAYLSPLMLLLLLLLLHVNVRMTQRCVPHERSL